MGAYLYLSKQGRITSCNDDILATFQPCPDAAKTLDLSREISHLLPGRVFEAVGPDTCQRLVANGTVVCLAGDEDSGVIIDRRDAWVDHWVTVSVRRVAGTLIEHVILQVVGALCKKVTR